MQPFLYTVAEDLKRRFGDTISRTAVIFNNKRPMLFLKRYLSEVYGKTILCPEMFTIQEFMAKSTDKAVAQEQSRFFVLFECYNELLASENKKAIDPDTFYPMSQTILADFDQIDYENVDAQAVYTYLKDTGEIRQQFSEFSPEQQQFLSNFWSSFSAEKQNAVQQRFIELWQRLPRLYRLFQKKLAEKNLCNIATVYRDLAAGKSAYPEFADNYAKIIFIGFNALNNCEKTLFKKWQKEEQALFYFDGDAYYFQDNMQESGLFLRRNLSDYGLKNALGNFPELLNDAKKEIFTYAVSGSAAQAKSLYSFFTDKETDNSPRQKAIILADETLLTAVLQSVPNERKINVTMGFPLRQSALSPIIHYWLSLQKKRQSNKAVCFSQKEIENFLNLNLPGISNKDRENIKQKWRNADSREFAEYLYTYNELCQQFFARSTTGRSCLDNLRNFIVLLLHQKAERKHLYRLESSLLLRIYQTLNQLKDRVAEYQPLLTHALTILLIQRCLSGLSAPLSGEPLEGIQIMGMLESRCLDFEEVYILGANEGILPYNGIVNTFIPDSLRRAFGLPLKEHKEALSAYLFFRVLQRAKKIHLFYNNMVDNHSTGEISRFVSQLAFESNLTIRSLSAQITNNGKTVAKPVLEVGKSKEVMDILNQYLQPEGRSFSASALKTYLDCPLQFFFKYIAGIKEPEETPEPFDAAVMGTAFHQTMQIFYEPFWQEKAIITKERIFNRMKELPEICRKALKDSLPFIRHERPDSRLIIAEKILIENAKLVLLHDANVVAPFRILELEKDSAVSLPLFLEGWEEPVTVNFKGIIDRVDEKDGVVRIVDYKTGGDTLAIKDGDLNNLFSHEVGKGNGAALQILFYTLLYYRKHRILAEPHLYIIRKLKEEGSALIFSNRRKDFQPPDLQADETMDFLETLLSRLISEIFDSNIPFKHNQDAKYCLYSPLKMLCQAEEILSDTE